MMAATTAGIIEENEEEYDMSVSPRTSDDYDEWLVEWAKDQAEKEGVVSKALPDDESGTPLLLSSESEGELESESESEDEEELDDFYECENTDFSGPVAAARAQTEASYGVGNTLSSDDKKSVEEKWSKRNFNTTVSSKKGVNWGGVETKLIEKIGGKSMRGRKARKEKKRLERVAAQEQVRQQTLASGEATDSEDEEEFEDCGAVGKFDVRTPPDSHTTNAQCIKRSKKGMKSKKKKLQPIPTLVVWSGLRRVTRGRPRCPYPVGG
jgi:hypothetical protein